MNHRERDRLAAILQDLKQKHGYKSDAELARAIGIKDQRFRSYMRAQNSAQGESLAKIEAFMGLSEGKLWDILYSDDDEIKSAAELIPLYTKLSQSEKKKFLHLVVEICEWK